VEKSTEINWKVIRFIRQPPYRR